jgi:aspartate kinase
LTSPTGKAGFEQTMALIVQKYGGSSLASPRHIQRAAERIQSLKATGKDVAVVVSAMGRMTDSLVRLAHRTVKAPPEREMDMLLSAGERVSMSLLSMALQERGVPAISFTGSQSGIVTTPEHTNARIIAIRAHRIREELAKGKVVIIAGFQGVSETKEVTTLGRGGSDTTAVALAAELGAECCEILTDVDGILTADPRVVPSARLIPECSYDEALELSSKGAKLQSRSVEVAKRFNVPVRVAPSHDTAAPGTLITSAPPKNVEQSLIRGVATRDGLTFFRARGSLTQVRDLLEREKITTRYFQVAKGECSWLADAAVSARLRDRLMVAGLSFEENSKACLVSVVGESISDTREVMTGFLQSVETSGAEIISLASNSLSLSVAVDAAHKPGLARLLHERFISP